MKLRIKGNSLRFRLTKTEVGQIAAEGSLKEETWIGNNTLTYCIQKKETDSLQASFENNKITLYVPSAFANEWPSNEIVGCNAMMDIPGDKKLFLLLEKDFVCLDETMEDQSDNYENPNQACAP